MPLHFSSILEEKNILEIAEKYGFTKIDYVEKFIMDFEMQYQIIQNQKCITRGGMCMPFYTDDHNANRLSIDIDLLTTKDTTETKQIMDNINKNISEIELEILIPKTKYPIDNLLSYRVNYDSILGKPDWVKVDFLCDVNIELSTKTIHKNYDLFALTTDYEMEILSRGALIGDKLTTLSLGKIGLPERKFAEIPKQIFDIGSQLRLVQLNDILEIFTTFETFTNFKVSIYHHSPPYTLNDVMTGIESSLFSFIEFDKTSVHLTYSQNNKFGNFIGTYLGKNHKIYKTEYVGNILLIQLLMRKFKEFLNSPSEKDNIASDFYQSIDTIRNFRNMNGDQIKAETDRLLSQKLPQKLITYQKMLKGQPIEYIYLLTKIYES